MFIQTPIPDATLLLDCWEHEPKGLSSHFQKYLAEHRGGAAVVLEDNFANYWDRYTRHEDAPETFYMAGNIKNLALVRSRSYTLRRAVEYLKKIRETHSVHSLFDHDLRTEVLSETVGRYQSRKRLLRIDKQLDAEYQRHTHTVDINGLYIYIPLHYQPECTTSPLGGVFVDQLLMITLLHRYCGKNVLVYVKEHPVQRSQGRYEKFYQDLVKLSKVRLVPKNFSSFTLIKNSLAVATITGTAGWEALFYQKPVLMFGEIFYKYAPGVFSIRSHQDCEEAFTAIKNGFKSDLSELKVFLRSLQEVAIKGFSDAVYQTQCKTNFDENVCNLSTAILQRLV
jgi:hypothetical protein